LKPLEKGPDREAKSRIPAAESRHSKSKSAALRIALRFATTDAFCTGLIRKMVLKHLVFEVVQQNDGNWTAAGIADDIFTQGSDFEDLKVNTVEAIRAHFFDEECDKFEVCFAQVVSQFVFAA
jgi:hypothetical protein